MLNFCTLFDSFYLTRGLALYESLEKQSSPFHLYIFAFDDTAYEVLKTLHLKHATIISLTEFEYPALCDVKEDRSQAEYCWTSTPSTISHCIKTYGLEHCTYLDADLYFYRDPAELIAKAAEYSVIITPHHYSPAYDQTTVSGRYCVQFMFFRADAPGMKVLEWWRLACLDWCYARVEDGKFGDQKYLDDWQSRFQRVLSTEEVGIGLAPWNVQQVSLHSDAKGGLQLQSHVSQEMVPLYFYHYHRVRFYSQERADLGDYVLDKKIINQLYLPYLRHVSTLYKKVAEIAKVDKLRSEVKQEKGAKAALRNAKHKLEKRYNVVSF